MRVKSTKRPPLYRIDINGDKAVVRFAENISEIVEEGAPTEFEYDCYALVTKNRKGLKDDISVNIKLWVDTAKKAEADKLSAAIRAKRDMLLAETDKEFALDRINLTIPDKVTASTMLNAVKDMFSKLGAVCNSEMAKYRQALRDIPQQEGFPYDVKFPTRPK